MTWKNTFKPYTSTEAIPLGNTLIKSGQGVSGTAQFLAGIYPACSEHGAMNKVSFASLWRCPTCNIGVEIQ